MSTLLRQHSVVQVRVKNEKRVRADHRECRAASRGGGECWPAAGAASGNDYFMRKVIRPLLRS